MTAHAEDDIMALVFGGVSVEKTTTVQSSHIESSTHVEKVVTVTKSFTHDSDGNHVHVEIHKSNGIENGVEEAFTHSSATFEAHVETGINGEHHLAVDSLTLHKDVELTNGLEAAVEVHLRKEASELGDRSPSRLSTATDATSVFAETYHVHTDEQEAHHEKDHIPFRTAEQDALVAQFKELHHAPPSLPTSLPPSEHVSRRGTYIEEHSILDDPIEIDREHELERIRIEAERVAELKRTLSKKSENGAPHIHRHIEDSSDEEGSVVPVSATHYEFDDRASIARTESFTSHHSAKRDSIDLYHEDHHHETVHEKLHEAVEQHVAAETMIGSGAAPIHIHTPVTSPLTESVFMSPVSPVPAENYESDIESRVSSLNPQFTGPHITDPIKAVEVLEHIEDHHHHHHHHEVAARHDSITSAGAVVRALEEMDAALQHHSSFGSERGVDDGGYSLNGSVRHKHHLYERLGSYSRASTPISGPPPPVPLWDLIKEEENARQENVVDAPAPLHRAAPLSHLEEISSNSVTNSVTDSHHHDHHGSKTSLVEAAVIAHHIHQHETASPQPFVRSSRYGSRHSVANGAIGTGVAPVDRKSSVLSNSSRGTVSTLVDDGARSRGSTLNEANVNGVHTHEHHHHHHTLGEVVAAHLIHEHIEHRIEEEVIKREIAHEIAQQYHEQQQSEILYEHQKSVASLMSQFGGGDKKAYTKDEADARRRIHEVERAAKLAIEAAAREEAERRAAEEAAALAAAAAAAAAVRAAEEARAAAARAAEEEAARHAAQLAAAAAIHHHEQQQAAQHGHSRSASVVSHRSSASYHVPPTPTDVPAPSARRDSMASVRTTRSVVAHRHAASRDPFATLPRPPPQTHILHGYTRNPMTSPSLVKKSPLLAAHDANKFSSVRVVRNVRGFIKEWGQKDFVPPARSPLSPTLAVWHEEGNTSRRSSIVSEGGQSLIGRPAQIEAAPRTVTEVHATAPAAPVVTPLTERLREYELTAAHTGLVKEKHHHGLPPMVNLLA